MSLISRLEPFCLSKTVETPFVSQSQERIQLLLNEYIRNEVFIISEIKRKP